MNKWFNVIRNSVDSSQVDITIHGEIVDEKWYDNDFSPSDLDFLKNIEADTQMRDSIAKTPDKPEQGKK